MKMKQLKRVLSCLMTAVCTIGLLAGCGKTNEVNTESKEESKVIAVSSEESKAASEESKEESKIEEEIVSYPLEGDIKLTYAYAFDKTLQANFKSTSETPFAKAWQEATGVTIEFHDYVDYKALNLMIASGELPDIIYFNMANYSGGISKFVEDNIAIPLNDYIEYAPDYMNVLESNDILLKSVSAPNGDIVGFANISDDKFLATSVGLMLRQDLLNKVGMDVPETAEQLYDVLKAFKEKLNIEAPFSVTSSYLYNRGILNGILTSPFGLPQGDFYLEDGKVHYGIYEQEYKDVLAYLAKLYDEKLLDQNFSTLNSSTEKSNFMNGISAVTMNSVGGGMGTYLSTMKDVDPEFDVTGFGPLVAKEGDTPMSTQYSNAVGGTYAVITTACKDPVAAVKFLNYGYTEEGHMLFAFGTEGESYEMVNGYPTYTEVITNNENGWTMQQALVAYSRAGHAGPYVADRRYMEQYSALPQQIEALNSWSNSNASEYVLPPTVIASADSAEYTKLLSDIKTYASEMYIKFVTGEESIDNFESVYLATLKKMNIERVIELQQAAYDAFMAR